VFICKTLPNLKAREDGKKSKAWSIFVNWLSFLSFHLIEFTLTGFIIGCFFMQILNETGSAETKTLSTISYIIILFVLLSIIVDFIKLIWDSISQFRCKKKKAISNKK
jgi:ACR3 family arsenite efflux pump ArsB